MDLYGTTLHGNAMLQNGLEMYWHLVRFKLTQNPNFGAVLAASEGF